MTRRFAAILLGLGYAVCSVPASSSRERAIPDVTSVAYGADPAQGIDIYQGTGPGPHKLVVFIHGGGWVAGNEHPGGRKLAAPLNRAGYTLASVGYRLMPRTDMAGSVSDAAHAVAYLLHNADKFDLQPQHFAIMGHSSGAHMAALLGTDQSYLQAAGVDPADLDTVIALDGVFDIGANVTHFPTEARREVFGIDPSQWQLYSPVSHVAGMKAHPEFCLLNETTNPRFVEQEHLFETALRRHGESVQTETAPGLKHAELIKLFDSDEPMAMFTLKCLAAAR